jgi:hypothetical protein
LYGRLNNYNNMQEEAESEKTLTYTLSVSGLTAIPDGLIILLLLPIAVRFITGTKDKLITGDCHIIILIISIKYEQIML